MCHLDFSSDSLAGVGVNDWVLANGQNDSDNWGAYVSSPTLGASGSFNLEPCADRSDASMYR